MKTETQGHKGCLRFQSWETAEPEFNTRCIWTKIDAHSLCPLPIAGKKRTAVGNEVDEVVGSQSVEEFVYPVEVFESLLFLEASLDGGGRSV